jgi:hypothetical protein
MPTPTPAASFLTTEYSTSDGPAFHDTIPVWAAGYHGEGSIIAIVDSGIDTDSPEFTGRLSPNSADVAGNGTVEEEDDHGTHVALVAAAARDGTGIVGIAYQATIMAVRADTPGTCASPDDCSFEDPNIAQAINHAVANGADVINLSIGGGAATGPVLAAIANAASAGVVVVVAAGNDGDSTDPLLDPDNPDPFASSLVGAGNGNVIIVGSVNDTGAFSSFSNRAGTFSASFISALGEDICCAYENGVLLEEPAPGGGTYIYLFSGTSFSAPQVAGAAALLKQAFPHLTGAEIVEILTLSATDAGVAGTDAVYGTGILDVANSFNPIGPTALAGGTVPLTLGDNTGIGSAAMGDSLTQVTLSSLVLDRYKRAYNVDLGRSLRNAPLTERLFGAVGTQRRQTAFSVGKASMAFSIDASNNKSTMPWSEQLRLTREDAEVARVLAARIALQLSPETQLGFTISESASGLIAQLQGQDRPAFMIASKAGSDESLFRRTEASFALRRQLGDYGLTVSAETGRIVTGKNIWLTPQDEHDQLNDRVNTVSFALDREIGSIKAALNLTYMDEERTVLGARFHDGLGQGGSQTLFLDQHASWQFADNWHLGGSLRHGFTRAGTSTFITSGSNLVSRAWSLDVTRTGLLGENDTLGLRVSQPLRVENGGLKLNLPVSFSYETLEAGYATRDLSLTPEGRELMGEISWNGRLWSGDASASLFYRREPGHYEYLPDDKGVALSWSRDF